MAPLLVAAAGDGWWRARWGSSAPAWDEVGQAVLTSETGKRELRSSTRLKTAARGVELDGDRCGGARGGVKLR
jgi:hypothetical protein